MPDTRPPVRIAHLGLGNFARSHQAWYTQVANDAHPDDAWGIAAMPSRLTPALAVQGCRFGLIVRGPDGDVVSTMDSVVAVEEQSVASPEVAILTLTVTESGYLPGGRAAKTVAHALRARREAGGGELAIVPCDNVPMNGEALRTIVMQEVDADLAAWIADTVSFVSTMVDRITPVVTDADLEISSEALGWRDEVPVVTEPFTEWVLQGDFPAGRPEWEVGGARFVDDVEPYERRKLWMLNAGHSLLAYRGLERGFTTVYEAWQELRPEVEQLWDEARPVLPIDATELDDWLAAVRVRWENPRMEHRLEQIAAGGEQKIATRIEAVIEAREAAGLGPGDAELEVIEAWRRWSR